MTQPPSKQTSWDLTQFSQCPSAALYFPESHQWSEISFLSEVILVLGKASSFGNPQISFQFSHHQLLIFVDCSPYTFNILRCSACCRPSRVGITFNRFSTIFRALVPHFYLRCTHCIISESLLNHPNIFSMEEYLRFTQNLIQTDSLLYSFSHFECNGHTIHTLTQWHVPPPLTSTVKSSLFTHAHSHPLSLAARFNRCHTNHFHYINNDRTISGQTCIPKRIESNVSKAIYTPMFIAE